METPRTSATKKRKVVGVRNDNEPEQYEISSIGIQIETIRCSICKRIPDKEIFHCFTPEPPVTCQHLVCEVCKHLDNICPVRDCFGKLVRDKIVEQLLDEVWFKCPWTEYGCTEECIARNLIASHQKDCEMNPNYLSCSDLFGSKCEYKYFTVFDNDEDKIKEMKEHLLSHNENLVPLSMNYGDRKEENFCIRGFTGGTCVARVLDWVKCDPGDPRKVVGTSIAVWLVDTDVNQAKTITPYFVSLAEDHAANYKTEVQMTIKSNTKSTNNIPQKCVPHLRWNTINQSTREFKQILMMTQQERIVRNYSIPIRHLENYFLNSDKEFPIQYIPNLVHAEK